MGTLLKVKAKMKLDKDLRKMMVRGSRDEILLDLDGDMQADIALTDANNDGDLDTFALDLTGSRIADYFGFHNAKTYLCFTALSGHDEELQGFVRFLYELESGEP